MIEIPGFVLSGAIRSKKTSQKIISIPKKGAKRCPACGKAPGFPKILPSDAHHSWHKSAMDQCLIIKGKLARGGVDLPVASLVNVRADFYQDVDRADCTGLYESLADLLQDAGIIVNDRLISSWNGSRRLKDAGNPRIEVYIQVIQPVAVERDLFVAVEEKW